MKYGGGGAIEQLRLSFKRGRLPNYLCSMCHNFIRVNDVTRYSPIPDLPRTIFVEVSSNCNLNCLSCDRAGIRSSRKDAFIDPKVYTRFLRDLAPQSGVHDVCFIGHGEPFASSNIAGLICTTREYLPDVHIYIATNGLLLGSDEMLRDLIRSGLDKIVFSIDGSDQKSYEKYHRGGKFDKALLNMRRLIECRNDMKSKKPEIVWQYLLFRWNDRMSNIDEAVRLSKKIGVDKLEFKLTKSPITGISMRYLPFKGRYLRMKSKHS